MGWRACKKIKNWQNIRGSFPGGSVVKNLPAMQALQETQFHPWAGKIPWRWSHVNPLRCSCLETPMNRGAWWATAPRSDWAHTHSMKDVEEKERGVKYGSWQVDHWDLGNSLRWGSLLTFLLLHAFSRHGDLSSGLFYLCPHPFFSLCSSNFFFF